MHRTAEMDVKRPDHMLFSPESFLDENRAVICQDCYERADGSNRDAVQKAVSDAVMDGVGMYKTEYVSPQQFNRDIVEACANAGGVGQPAGQGVYTQEGQRKLAEQAKSLDVPVARAKLEMPTEYEHDRFMIDYLVSDGSDGDSIQFALNKFVERRNAKL
jgi:hypothetical protein